MALSPHVQSLFWLLGYFIPRYGAGALLDSLHPHATYVFELLFVAAYFFCNYAALRIKAKLGLRFVAEVILAVCLGGTARVGCTLLNIPFPLDLSSQELIVLLLVVSPILEEALFRQALLLPLEQLLKGRKTAIIAVSALLFSAGHLAALFILPPEYHGFIYYQGAYTMVLGLWLGHAYYRYGGLVAAVLLHGGFNLGFFVADRFW